MDELDLLREEGFRSYVRHMGRGERNPYPKGSVEHKQFQNGWKQAAFICGRSSVKDNLKSDKVSIRK